MDFISLDKYKGGPLSSGKYYLSGHGFDNLCLSVKENEHIYLHISLENNISPISVTLNENVTATINIVNTSNNGDFILKVSGYKNSNAEINIADFSSGKSKCKIDYDLLDEQASVKIFLATLSKKSDDKLFTINVNHLHSFTNGKVECYGVAKDTSRIIFAGSSFIANKSIKSNTNQIAKAMIFDKSATAIAKPILGISENDVIASHSAAVGKINDEHIYYLTSRGLTLNQARELITLGYLKPIIKKFDEDNQELIAKLIERDL